MPGAVTIRVDHREPNAIIPLLERAPNVEVVREGLPLGDFVLNDTVVVERKDCSGGGGQATDLEQSVIEADKRLFNQSEQLKLADDAYGVFLLEGDAHRNAQRMLVQQVDGALSFLGMVQGLSVLTTLDLTHTAYVLVKLATHQANGLGYLPPLRGQKPKKVLDQQRFILEGIPGVSPELAEALLGAFGSVRAVVEASPEALAQVPGIGPKKAHTIHEALNGVG